MEKRTVLAIVLSTIVFLGFQVLNTKLYPPNETVTENNTAIIETNEITIEEDKIVNNTIISIEDESNYKEELINLDTDVFNVTFNTKGANISSLKLKNYKVDVDRDEEVDLVLQEIDNNSLLDITLSDTVFNKVFSYEKLDDYTFQFKRTFTLNKNNGNQSSPITLIKTYKFLPDEYMFELKVTIKNSEDTIIPLNSDGSLYSLNVTKQIGPNFEKLDRREDYRKFSVFTDGKRDELKVKRDFLTFDEKYEWAAIEGKFFTLAIIPDNNNPTIDYSTTNIEGKISSELNLNRSNLNNSYIEDTYKIYLGPKDKSILEKYNRSDKNGWNLKDTNINKIINFWFLGMFFMWVLELINALINNFGISIIVLTILIKIILYPFTKKSFESMGKMQTIQPEIKLLQDKYKDDPAKLNAATAELYKKEGVNPLGGCLPMLLQMPIFITFYSLFNEYIGLRGSTFIPGWIIDLSKPEYIFQFGFELPILGWDALRLLPIIYVATQLISMKFTQNNQKGSPAGGASAMQTKMMTLGMPIMFFFIMYNQSSGLLLYWITQNVISSAQQIQSKKKSDKEHDLILKEKLEKKNKKKGRKK
ncbi:membrane protein insertase YidC [Thiospirochaeta perfilievii]|uniref:Membrane protein insertase YidC n=1 Tax=Thiospirochaeta perfilievii TaxID=252967 RepID=A0A5C1QDP7_9SPIO|nr:membrane protein insertase YidC [Thiospirochaeta perfilievii]QEN04776.1 membrane protein insertase YidC [Thiospirochaeta perfilievii]